MLNNVILVSDFRDWYDHMFDKDGIAFSRMSQHLGRREALTYMRAAGLRVPKFGTYADFHETTTTVVAHKDDFSHQGYGKILFDLFNYPVKAQLDELNGLTLVEYLVDKDSFGVSFRDLWVGDSYCRLKYESGEWRSNVGNVSISVLDADKYFDRDRPSLFDNIYPLLAMDYIMYCGHKYYIDLNTSPGVPKEIGMTATEVVENIKSFMFRRSC